MLKIDDACSKHVPRSNSPQRRNVNNGEKASRYSINYLGARTNECRNRVCLPSSDFSYASVKPTRLHMSRMYQAESGLHDTCLTNDT